MKRGWIGIAAVVASLGWAPDAHGQQTTERYIPVGQSPGVSGVYSDIGQIESVDASNRTVTVSAPEGARTITVTEETSIWLDRSELRLTNETGSMADLRPGRSEVCRRRHEGNGRLDQGGGDGKRLRKL